MKADIKKKELSQFLNTTLLRHIQWFSSYPSQTHTYKCTLSTYNKNKHFDKIRSKMHADIFYCALLYFIELHRCCIFYKLKTRPCSQKGRPSRQKDYSLFYCNTCFNEVMWNQTHNISDVCLYIPGTVWDLGNKTTKQSLFFLLHGITK